MMEHLRSIDVMSSNDTFDRENGGELDLNLDDCGVEFDSGDFETLLNEESKLTSLEFEDQELQDLMAEEPDAVDNMRRPPVARNDIGVSDDSGLSDGFDPLEKMPFNDIIEENEILGDFLKEAEGSNLANHSQDPLQRMLDAAIDNEPVPIEQNPPLNVSLEPPIMDTSQLEAEKQHLLNQLEQLKQQNQMSNIQTNMNMNMNMNMNNQFVQQGMQRQQDPFSAPQKNYFAAPQMNSFVASVASVKTAGSTGETPLQSFLRSGRKSMNETQPMPQHSSLLQKEIPGAPAAASIFSHMPMELDAMNSQSRLFASNSFIGGGSNSQTNIYNPMDNRISATTQDLLMRKMLGNDTVQSGPGAHLLNRQGSGRNLTGGNGANAPRGFGRATSVGAFKNTGMLRKQASESHLLRGTSMPSKKNGLSRENLRYGLLKKQGSRGNLGSSGNLGPRRRSAPNPKHKLDVSQSVPHLSNSNRQLPPSGGYQGNAQW